MTRMRLVPLLLAALASACARHDSGLGSLSPGTGTPRFETRIEIPTGLVLHSDFAVGDFDGDQDVDMVVVGYTGDLQVMIGSGSVFTPGQHLAIGGHSFWIDQGDFDRDGDIDLAVLQKDGYAVTVLINDGNATFTPGPSYAIGPDSLQVLVADANEDGLLDLMVARINSPEIVVFAGDGHGAFSPTQSITVPDGGESFTLAVGDVTHDGLPDLVVSDPLLDRVLIYPGRPVTVDFAPNPTILPIPGAPGWCSIGDLDGDGLVDLAVSAFAANQFVIVHSFVPVVGVTTYTATNLPIGGHPALSKIGDVTGDGRNDLVGCVIERSSIVVLAQLAQGGFAAPEQLDATGLPSRPAIVDVDHNGHNDVLALSGFGDRINLWLSRFNGQLIGARNYASGLIDGELVVAADLDRDGVPEIITGAPTDTRLSILRPRADRSLALVQTIDIGAPVQQLRVVDIDLDGRPDLIVPVPTGVKVVRNRATAAALDLQVLPSTTTAFGTGQGPFGATAADLDRDGRLDLAIADFASGNVQILRGGNSPFDFSAPPRLLAVGGGPVDVVAADFTGDGILDLAVSRNAQSDIALYANDGRGNLSLFVNLPVGAAPNVLLTDDIDRDGRSDIVVANGDDNTISVLFGGPTGFTSRSYAAGSFPDALAVGDLTGDGLADVLVASRLGEDFRVLVNDGGGGFANVFPFPGTRGASSVALADLDGDGDRELLIGSVLGDRISVVNNLRSQAAVAGILVQ